MSKKLASGSDVIVLDVKTGLGAFMKKEEDAKKLAETMVSIGTMAGKKTAAVITDMDQPLGNAIGNYGSRLCTGKQNSYADRFHRA